MQAIIPTLRPGDTGPSAGNLVEAVLLLVEREVIKSLDKTNTPASELAETARVELSTSTFGPATCQLVVYFQLEQGLGEKLRGVVEEKTAARLNRLLKQLGPLEATYATEPAGKGTNAGQNETSFQFVVRGRITYANGFPASEVLVKAFEVRLCKKRVLRETNTNCVGVYEAECSLHASDLVDTRIGFVVEVYGPSQRLLVASAIQYGLASTLTVDLVLPESERGPSEYERYLASLKPILQDVSLGQLTCGEDDLKYLAGASGVPLDRMEMLVAAEKMARIDGDTGAQLLYSQRQKSSSSLEKASSSHEAHAGLLTSTVFYAWMRLGEPREREKILADQPAKLLGILKKAGEDNLIPALPSKDLEAIQGALLGAHTSRILQPSPQGAPASFGDSLSLLRGSDALSDDQKRLLAQVTVDRVSAEDVLEAAKLTPRQAGGLRQVAALHQLSDGDSALLQAACQHVLGKSDTTPTLPLHAIADLDEAAWQQILKAARPQGTDLAEIEKTSKRLVERTAELLPNAFLLSCAMRSPDTTQLEADLSEVAKLEGHNKGHGFKTRFDALKLDGIAAGERRTVRASFDRIKKLANRYPGLEFDALAGNGSIAEKVSAIQERVGLIGKFVAANPDTNFLALDYVPGSPDVKALKFDGLQDTEKAMILQTMKGNWRAFRVAGGALKAQQLKEAGFHSATATAGTTLEEFVKATNLQVPEAAAIHANASDIALDASLQFMAIRSLVQPLGKGTGNPIHSITQPPEIMNHLKRFDGFKDLFGAQAICRCQHCRSVLGPAAYFVDLMRFIDKNVTQPVFDNNPQADQTLRLQYRRPDLWVLPLTCENSDKLVPTLDLVNEILENFIDGQRTPTANQRSQIQKGVYLQLAQAKDSLAQPYVLSLKKVEEYLSHFQLTRAQIAETFELDADTTARAVLGISLNERDLIVNAGTNAQLDKLFGTGITGSTSADTQLFLALTTWTRDELGQLFKTQFVQGGNAITIQPSKASGASVQNDKEVVSRYSRPALDRLHRFTRLWRAIRQSQKWSTPELDLILSSLAQPGAGPTLTVSILVDIAKLLQVQKRLAVSVEQLCALVADVPRTNLESQRSLFDRLFNLDSFVISDGPWPPAAPLNYQHPSSLPAAANPATVTDNSRLTQRLMAGLQASDEELVQILKGLNWFSNSASLDVKNLSLLYRHALLARTLKLAIPDLFELLALGNVANARLSNLADLQQLLKTVDDWRETASSIDDVIVITGGTPTDPSAYPDATAIASAVADQIRSGHLLEFAVTALSQVERITADQSKEIVLDQQNSAVFEPVPGSEHYRLKATADPNANTFALAGIPPNVSLSDVLKQLNLYHTRNVLEKLLAARFKVSEGAMEQLSAMWGKVLTKHDANLTQELYGSGPATILRGIVTKFIPLVVLFKDKVWDEDSLAFVASNSGVFDITTPLFGGPNPSPLLFSTVLKVAAYARLVGVRDQGFTSEEDPPDSLAVQTVLMQGFSQDPTVAKALRVALSQLSKIKAYMSLDNTKPFEGLQRLSRAISLTQQLGLGGAALALLVPTVAGATDEYNQLTDAADALVGVLRAKYPDEQKFAQVMEPYEDILRSRKRDGLVEYVIRSMNRGFASPSDLYQFFLIDTQVEGCARTARLVAAHGSLQLYMQRVLMNLERSGPNGPNEFNVLQILANSPMKPLSRIQVEWPWRSAYRVWEANRKVFLNPENYLEPELRDNKTPVFEELESTLLQQRINEENATNAYTQYLEGYEEVASLKIAGAFHDIDENGRIDRLHLFGATADDPPIHYYRTIDNVRFSYEGKRRSYTPWQKLNVQIPVREVCPAVFEGRLFIFWVQITTTPTNKVEKGESRFVGYQHRFSFNYSEKRVDGTWTPPQKVAALDRDAFPFERLDDPLEEPTEVNLQAEIPSSKLPAAIAQANNSETLFMPVPIMDTSNPSGFKQVNVQGSGGQSSTEYVFQLVRVAPNSSKGGYTPRYDTTGLIHQEPVDGYTLRTPEWTRVHAEVQGARLLLAGMDTSNLLAPYSRVHTPFVGVVDLFERTAQGNNRQGPPPVIVHGSRRDWSWLSLSASMLWRVNVSDSEFGRTVLFPSTMVLLGLSSPATYVAAANGGDRLGNLSRTYTNAVVVNRTFGEAQAKVAPDAIVDFVDDSVMFSFLDGLTAPAHDKVAAQALTGVSLERLGTTIRRQLRRQLFTGGLGNFLASTFQMGLNESDAPISLPGSTLLLPEKPTAFSFNGPFGLYFQEIFFHIPFLVANNLNSQQRFSAAQRWYHYIFDPTSSDVGPNRVWQYRKFKEELFSPDALRKALTDPDALEAYRRDPFNPHAVARLRPGSYQKAIVMKYIDNLLDWGDTLFTEFTMESLNEATMLYALAADILGPRPPEVGDCGEASATPLTYADLTKSLNDTSDFLIELEHFSNVPVVSLTGKFVGESLAESLTSLASATASNRMPVTTGSANVTGDRQIVGSVVGLMDFGDSNGNHSTWRSAGGTDLRTASSYGTGQGVATNRSAVRGVDDPYGGARVFVGGDPINPPEGGSRLGGDGSIPNAGGLLPHDYTIPDKGIVRPGTVQPSPQKTFGGSRFSPHHIVKDVAATQPAFCIPPNPDFLAYWDRVEDRLYKIRNCMDITGARRQPSLYAPELDPRQLVKDRAAGLPLDDVLNGTTGDVPPYRFSFLVDKAKQYASTVQSFGSALLSALEKKDTEQLSRLRAVQEQNILKLRTRVQELEIEAGLDTLAGLERQRETVELRQAFYEAMLQNGLIPWERTQQVSRHTVSSLHSTEAILGILGGVFGLLPQFGAPTAMKYGGAELSKGAAQFGLAMQALAQVAESVSASAGLEATFQRRDEDWHQQKKLADKELENLKRQIDAANVRITIATRSLEVHNKSIDHAEETFQFYQDKFSSYGLYSLLSAQLQRSYREAYNAAFAVAKMVEQAYRYERDYDSAVALSNSYWSQDKGGLLAGERLSMDLQNLERRYLETNYRTLEVEQSFSLAQVAPSALVALRETGVCTFKIPEALFDLVYPGQYRRRIKGVRLTIPCVVGPYTSIGATLRLTDSWIRDNTDLQDTRQPRNCSLRHTTVVSTSTAQNDSGTFEFNFRDERYMPFEGLGGIDTKWDLNLPATFRSFDYRTISDVVLRISYTAEEDSTLRTTVENLTNSGITSYLKNTGTSRIFSLRHEFPDVWNQLVRKPLNTAVVFELGERHLPYVASYLISNKGQSLATAPITLLLQTKTGVGNPGASFEFDGTTLQNLQTDQPTGLPGKATNSLQAVRTHTMKVLNAGLLAPPAGQPGAIDESKLEDILLRVDIKLQ